MTDKRTTVMEDLAEAKRLLSELAIPADDDYDPVNRDTLVKVQAVLDGALNKLNSIQCDIKAKADWI